MSGDGPAPAPERLHQLDGLRAVAVSLVVFCHTFGGPVADALRARGFDYAGDVVWFGSLSGVELFFVLSGAVLLRSYARRRRPFALGHYAARRFERIYPPYWVALVFAGLVIAVTTRWPSWFALDVLPRFDPSDWLRQLPILSFSGVSYNNAWWSLEIELLFYLAVPIFVGAVARPVFTRRVALGAVAVSVALAVLSAVLWSELPRAPLSSIEGVTHRLSLLASYAPCFVIGVAIAAFDWSRRFGAALAVLGAAYVGVAIVEPRAGIHAGFALLYGGIVILSSAVDPLRSVLSRGNVVWLGERSYSLFLVHISVLYLVYDAAAHVFPDRSAGYVLVTRAVGIPAAVLAAMVLFWVVERRFARGLVTGDSFWPFRPSGSRRPVTRRRSRAAPSEAPARAARTYSSPASGPVASAGTDRRDGTGR